MHKDRIAYAMLAFSVANNIRIRHRNRKVALAYLEAVKAYEEDERILRAKLEWACTKLDENNIGVTEFDLIMLNNDLI